MNLKKLKQWLGTALTLGALAGIAYAAYAFIGPGRHDEKKLSEHRVEKGPVVVTTDTLTRRPVRKTLSVVGSLWGWEEVPLSAKAEGRVAKIRHDVGDHVKPGELLFELDPTDHQLAVTEAKRGLELELAKVGLKELPGENFDISRLPPVLRAASMKNQTQSKADRLRRLRTSQAAAIEEAEQAETDLLVAGANYQQALLDTQATLAAARHRQAALESAEQRLKDTKIVVPFPTGLPKNSFTEMIEYVVCQRNIAEGEMVRVIIGPEMPAQFRLAIDRILKLQVTIPERHLGEVKLGQDVELHIEAYPGEKFLGKVSRIHPAVDRASRSFKTEILIPNLERKLRPGSFARADILVRPTQSTPMVPEEAIVTFAGVTKIFTLVDGKAKVVPVRLGVTQVVAEQDRQRTWVEIDAPLPEGTPIITTGQTKLADDTPVRLRGS